MDFFHLNINSLSTGKFERLTKQKLKRVVTIPIAAIILV